MDSGDRYIVRPNPQAPGLWDVVDTMHDNAAILGGEALSEGQARELAATLNRHWREWRQDGRSQC